MARSQFPLWFSRRQKEINATLSVFLIIGFLLPYPMVVFAEETIPATTTSQGVESVEVAPTADVVDAPTASNETSAPVADETAKAALPASPAPSSALPDEEASSQSAMSGPSGNDDPSKYARSASNPDRYFYGDFIGGPFTYSYPITIPPGRDGVQPDIKLNYSSDAKRNDSIYGYGWSMPIPYIERINKFGTDNLFNQDKAHSFFYSSMSGEILPLLSTSTIASFLGISLSAPRRLAQLDTPSMLGELSTSSLASIEPALVGSTTESTSEASTTTDETPSAIETGSTPSLDVSTTTDTATPDQNTPDISPIASSSLISFALENLSAHDRANVKAQSIAAQVGKETVKRDNYTFEFTEVEAIDGGVQVFVRVWDKNGEQIGFGPDGTVDIERFRFFNPPILVPDPTGVIVRKRMAPTSATSTRAETESRFREDPREALLQSLTHTLSVKQEAFGKENIVDGKIGNTTDTYYPNANPETSSVDGIALKNDSGNWTTTRNAASAATGESGDTSNPENNVCRTGITGGGNYAIGRGFFLFDTSPISDTDSVNSATLSFYVNSVLNGDNDGDDTINIVSSSPASNTAIGDDDYDQVGSASFSSRDISGLSTGAYVDLPLNATGTASISVSGVSKFGCREGHDLGDTAVAGSAGTNNLIDIMMADSSGTTLDPKLVVEHTAMLPGSLLVNGLANPSGVTTTAQYFSAINVSASTTALATSYQIQISTSTSFASSLYWDSGKLALASSTPMNQRSPDISATTTFAVDGTKYYWRIKFWNQMDQETSWSASGDFFVMQVTGTYLAKVDDGSFIRYTLQPDGSWVTKDKRGWTYIFGATSASRLDNPATSTEIFRWMLSEVRDPNGNGILYTYTKDGGQIYPQYITYTDYQGSAASQVEFVKSLRGTNDQATSSMYGFITKTKYVVSEIYTRTNNSVVHKYQLTYGAGDNQARTMLTSVQETGYPESGTSTSLSLSPVTFSYQLSTTTWTQVTSGYVLPADFTDSNGADLGNRLVDVNGDALPDWIRNTGTSYVALNVGTMWDTAGAGTNGWTIPVLLSDGTNDKGTRFADVNADGLVDIIAASSTNVVYINNGVSTWVASSSWTFPESFIDASGHDLGVQIADINGDGLPDVLRSYYESGVGTTSKVYIHNGTGWTYTSSWAIPELFVDNISGTQHDFGARLYDYSGDGLVDIVRSGKNPNVKLSYLNNGRGWQLDGSLSIPEYFADASSTLQNADLGVRFSDLSGDGQSDMAKAQVSVSPRTVNLNNLGMNWLTASSTFPEDFQDATGKDYGVRLDDIDGDGQIDVVRGHDRTSEGQGDIRNVYVKNGVMPDLLRQIVNEHGGRITLAYQASSKYATGTTMLNQRLPFIYQTVSAIGVDSGVGLEAHRVVSTTTYKYQNGTYYGATILDRQFPGFGVITKTNDKGESVKSYFHQGNVLTAETELGEFGDHVAKAGRVYRTETYGPTGNILQTNLTKWARADYGDGRNFVKPVQTNAFAYSPANSTLHRDTAQTITYDDSTGNSLTQTSYGEVTGVDSGASVGTFTDIGSDAATTTITYAASSTNAAMSMPSRTTLTDQSGYTVTDAMVYYDNLASGLVAAGNPTVQTQLKSTTTWAYATTSKSYNQYGLVTQSIDPRGATTTIAYDTLNLFSATTTNPLGHTQTFSYDYSSGKVATATDENSRMRVTDYDALDRPIREKVPDFATPTTLVTKSEYSYTDNLGYITATTTVAGLDVVLETFNTAVSGGLEGSNTGNGWIGPWSGTYGYYQGFTIQSSVSSEGAKAVQLTDNANTEPTIRRNFLSTASGTVHFAMRRDLTDSDAALTLFDVQDARGLGRAFTVSMSNDGYFHAENGNTEISLGIPYSANQWYDIQIDFDCSTDLHRIKIGANAWSPWYSFHTPKTTISNAVFMLGSSAGSGVSTNYWDNFGVGAATTTYVLTYSPPASVFRRDYLSAATSTDTYTYLDGFNRVIQTRREVEPENGWEVKDTIYNTQALVDQDSVSYFSATSSYASATTTGSLYTTYQYDALGRAVSLSDVFGTVANTYDRWSVFSRDPLNNVKMVTRDAYGNVAQVDEQDGVATRTTAYLWNRQNKLTRLTDSMGNVRHFAYDNRGRLTLSEDLHAAADTTFGTTTRSYDDAGNVTQIVNPRAQTINYAYDALNRPTSEDYTGAAGTEVEYFYDTCTNGKGRLCSVRKQGEATTTFLYNSVGLVTDEGKVIGLGASQSSATTSYTFFRNGAQDRLTYPDASQVYYIYDNAGLLDRVLNKESGAATSSVVTRITYTPLGQTEAMDYANGVTSTSTYDNTQKYRLTQKLTQKGTTTLQNLNYTYDAVGNITSVNEYASTSARKSVVYTYDPLYRLTSASTTAVATGTTPYNESYGYDALGNLLSRTVLITATTSVTSTSSNAYALSLSAASGQYASKTTPSGLPSGSGARTIQAWVKASISSENTVACWGSQNSYLGFSLTIDANKVGVRVEGGNHFWTATNIADGNWHHVAVTYSGGDISSDANAKAYLDGSTTPLTTSASAAATPNTNAGYVRLGTNCDTTAASNFTGSIDDVRIYDTTRSASAINSDYATTLTGTETNLVGYWQLENNYSDNTTNGNTLSGFGTPTFSSSVPFTGTTTATTTILFATTTYQYAGTGYANPDAPTIVGSTTYTYDNAGNMSTAGTSTYAWDYNNRMTQTVYGSATSTYLYDDTGARVQMSDNATTTSYFGRFYQATNGGYKKTKNIYVNGVLVATTEKTGTATATPYYVSTDNLGGASVLTNSSGVATQTLDYLPFGDIRVNAKATSFDTARKYIGQLNDVSTNLDYLNARYYDAARGQFTGQDPVSRAIALNPTDRLLLNPQEQNFYSYALNNPIKLSDPTGESAKTDSIQRQIQILQIQIQILQIQVALLSFTSGALNPVQGVGDAKNTNLSSSDRVAAGAGTALGVATFVKSIGSAAVSAFKSVGSSVAEGVGEVFGKPSLDAVKRSITQAYKRPSGATNAAQRASVQGQACVDCATAAEKMNADHIYPLVQEYYETGAINLDRMRSIEAVQPQCPTCSAIQGGILSQYSQEVKAFLGLTQ